MGGGASSPQAKTIVVGEKHDSQVESAMLEASLVALHVSKALSTADRGLLMAADVGGTNSRFMLYDVDLEEEVVLKQRAPGALIFQKKYSNFLFANLYEIVERFLQEAAKEAGSEVKPHVAALAVAGVVSLNRCRLTNLDWIIDSTQIETRFGIGCAEIMNDFVAQGYGVLTLGADEVTRISGSEPVLGGTIGCIGAGTGLGQCFLTAPSPLSEYSCFPSEGGHAEFAPRGAGNDETQIDLLRYLKVKFSAWNRISFERVVSGKGICNIYEFLAYKNPSRVDKTVHSQFLASKEDASIVAKNATKGSLCEEALKLFADSYGAVCGTFALQIIPFGGLYLTGGVTQRLADFLQEDPSFLEAYFDKGRVSPILRDIPLLLVKGDEMGQRGAHLRGVRLLHRLRAGTIEGKRILSKPPASHDLSNNLAPPRSVALAEIVQSLHENGPAGTS
eukprot:TRINITY_DN15326_c0_g1_i4.p1 TRINITY_DN15326_c0_g1~~TRINITY_DN15326_c0_g1_i4.p1  ORF type:complete len:448 (-),score=89.79 TRINITY_DN15326_c0_g1_i4:113-1456(-)